MQAKNYFEIVRNCWNNSVYLLSLNNRVIIIPEFSLWADARYRSPFKHFYRVAAKKNVHFRPEIIHFLPARWTLFCCKLLLLWRHLYGWRWWYICQGCQRKIKWNGAFILMRMEGSAITSSAETVIASASRASVLWSFHVPSTVRRGGRRKNENCFSRRSTAAGSIFITAASETIWDQSPFRTWSLWAFVRTKRSN